MRFNPTNLLVFDIEANGLADATKVWCININGDSYYGATLAQGIERLSNPDALLVGHNIINYDLPLLNRLYGLKYDVDHVYDTAIMSRLLQPDRGGHSLEKWGERVGIRKLPDLNWKVWDEGMLPRCATDVEITKAVYDRLCREQAGWDWSKAAWIEHWTAHYHQRQERNGVQFDVTAAIKLADEIEARLSDIEAALKSKMLWQNKNAPRTKRNGTLYEPPVTLPFKADGGRKQVVINLFDEPETVCGPYVRVEMVPPNPSSPDQLKTFLYSMGWEPDEWNYVKDPTTGKPLRPLQKSSPKLSDSSLKPLGEVGELVRLRGVLQHRLSLLRNRTDDSKGLINNVRPDGRVVAGGIPMGTPTGRYTHRGVVNIPRARDSSEYGKELRSLFIAAEGHVLCGSDAKQLEARMEAHYTYPYDNGEYARELLDGDIHQKNADMWGVARDPTAKNGKYALLYGAQPPKLAQTLGLPKQLGAEYFDMFWEGNYALKELNKAVQQALYKGFLIGVDGRKLFIRSSHSALNTLFQSAGSIIVKLATIYVNQELDRAIPNWKQVVHMHDEFLLEFPSSVNRAAVNEIIQNCWNRAGRDLNINVPIEGDTKWGSNWAEVH